MILKLLIFLKVILSLWFLLSTLRKKTKQLETERAEVGRLRTAFRVNALRFGSTDEKIDLVLYPKKNVKKEGTKSNVQ